MEKCDREANKFHISWGFHSHEKAKWFFFLNKAISNGKLAFLQCIIIIVKKKSFFFFSFLPSWEKRFELIQMGVLSSYWIIYEKGTCVAKKNGVSSLSCMWGEQSELKMFLSEWHIPLEVCSGCASAKLYFSHIRANLIENMKFVDIQLIVWVSR